MQYKELIESRRSVRKFSERSVERELLREVVGSVARYAPSSRNSHSTRFLIVDDKELLERISEMRDYGSAFVKGAACAILVMGDKTKTDLWQVNCSISTTMLLESLVEHGLKGCWVHVEGRPVKREEPDGEQAEAYLRGFLPIPEECGVLCLVACGYSDFEPQPLPQWDVESTIQFYDK